MHKDHLICGSDFDAKINDVVVKTFHDAQFEEIEYRKVNPYKSHVKIVHLENDVDLVMTETCDGFEKNPRRMIIDINKGGELKCGAGFITTDCEDYEDKVLKQVAEMLHGYIFLKKFIEEN